MAAARRATSASSRPQHTVLAAENRIEDGSRPASVQAYRTRPNAASVVGRPWNAMLNSSAYRAASRGVRRVPVPPRVTGGFGRWAGLGSAGKSASW